ncbi:hypothetical protein F4809DRAFT_551377 [Biscogniauxia mediterranea]|nr:hypothetical protein F4809DRAFT_551377 [Biscogniauxia mediterranea]
MILVYVGMYYLPKLRETTATNTESKLQCINPAITRSHSTTYRVTDFTTKRENFLLFVFLFFALLSLLLSLSPLFVLNNYHQNLINPLFLHLPTTLVYIHYTTLHYTYIPFAHLSQSLAIP